MKDYKIATDFRTHDYANNRKESEIKYDKEGITIEYALPIIQSSR